MSVSYLKNREFAQRVFLHVLFWTGVYVYNVLENWTVSDNKVAIFEFYAARLFFQMVAAYLLTYAQIPGYLLRRRYWLFAGTLFLAVYTLCGLYATYRTFYFEEAYPGYFKVPGDRSYLLYVDALKFLMYASALYTPAVVMASIKFIRAQYEERQRRELLEKEKLQTELSFLKIQLNPHFLFNTLNNLYMLTLKSSPQAPEVVSRLADTLDYMLYRCHDKVVALKGEIQLIENYLLLEKLRLNDNVRVTFTREENVPSLDIAPLIMLSLVENAFKHGVMHGGGSPYVEIGLAVSDTTLTFHVRNSKSTVSKKSESGIGLGNVRRQLELIYGDGHVLTIDDTSQAYRVELKINLN